jgi:hypothetical protein
MKKNIKNKVNNYKIEVYGGIKRVFSKFCDKLGEQNIKDILSSAYKPRDFYPPAYSDFRLSDFFIKEDTLNLQDFNIEGLNKQNKWEIIGICRIRKV